MNSAVAMAISLAVAFGGYYLYSAYIDRRVIKADPDRATPARMYMDGVDFMPASRHVLFGYQFKSIAALGPVVGPIVALQWGWLAGFLWILLGCLLFGWAHDYGSAMMGLRNEGQSLGALSYRLISPRGRTILLSFLYFYLILICAAFADIVAKVMTNIGSIPVPVFGLMILGILTGLLIYRAKIDILITTIVMVVLALGCIWLGTVFNLSASLDVWLLYTLLFAYLGAVLPIWAYAQPINYIAFYLVFFGIIGAVIGIFVGRPTFTAPVFTTFEVPLGYMWPVLFVTIACGAISGWHGLVSTSGTARQLERETDTRYVVSGSMFTEMVLATVALIVAATFTSYGAYKETLAAGPAAVFTTGMSGLLGYLGIPASYGTAFAGAMFVILAITILQLAVRFARVATQELAPDRVPLLRNTHVGALLALAITWVLVKTGTFNYIWVLFGGSNQLLAALALLMITIWLASEKKNYLWTLYPMWFMLVTTIAALLLTCYSAFRKGFDLIAGVAAPAPGKVLGMEITGNLIAGGIGVFLVVSAILLARDGLKALFAQRASKTASTG